MKSPTSKIQSPVCDSFVKVEPLFNPEPDSVPPLISGALVTVPAAHPSGQPLAPDVRDATSVAASLLAWDGYPTSSPMLQENIPALGPAKPSSQLLDVCNPTYLSNSETLPAANVSPPAHPSPAWDVVTPLTPRGGK